MIGEWNVPFTLQSPLGTLELNDVTSPDGYYVVVKEKSRVGPRVRVTQNNIPQADGSIPHRRWLTGVEMTMTVKLMENIDTTACGALKQTMLDLLNAHARALLRAGDNEGRMLWTPDGADRRMLDDIRLLEYPEVSFNDGDAEIAFTVSTGYPYAIDLTQTLESAGTITMLGTADFWPVVQVSGSNSWTLTNNDALDDEGNPLSIVYDSSRPGAQGLGGGYAEIDMFRGTIYLNGSGANLLPGVDIENSDVFPLVVGANDVTLSSGSASLLVNTAWA